jgi:hypothetical protein
MGDVAGADAGGWGGGGGGVRKGFFLKKEAKTFARLGVLCRTAEPPGDKVFWFFFFKKELLSSCFYQEVSIAAAAMP